MSVLKPINEGRLLKDRAYSALREAIIAFELRPGEPLTERRLTQRLGVSKSPIRDALIQLEQEGLVRSTPFKGFEVAPLTEEALRNTFQFWEAIEAYCVAHFARHATPERLAALESTCEEHARLIRAGEGALAVERNRFHPILLESLENPMFEIANRMVQAHVRRIRNFARTIPGRLEKTIDEHARILDAIRAHDADVAQQQMRAHIYRVLDEVLASERLRELVPGR